ncbi:MAG TPA: hypothetical protein DCM87_01285 [Planctomycetes bacterium]|nr:hypothetical protein [Planctomycetota bacterium]
MQRFMLVVLAGLLIVSFGCKGTQTPSSGVVSEPSLQAAPEVTFTSDDGKQWRMSQLYGDVTIVSFVTAEGKDCALVSPPILAAAKAQKGEGIPIVEVVYPTGDCKSTNLKVAFHERTFLYTLLEDPNGRARAAFGVGAEDKVFLVGENGKILKEAAPSNVAALIEEAKKIEHKKSFSYPDTLTF